MQKTGERQVQSLSQEDPLTWEMATQAGILAQKIPRIEETGVLQSMRPQGVGHNWVIEHYGITRLFCGWFKLGIRTAYTLHPFIPAPK